jgi:Zn-dependent peptidase ImmA (M78 family)/transcriptional regulator with XRE-family HTH domain
MAISAQELGRRLREAREACAMTQEQVGRKLELSRASVAQMELGNRQVTSLELDRLAYLYGRDLRTFLSEQFEAQDALTVMFRAHPDLGRDGQVADSLRRCIALGRELSNLEELVGVERETLAPTAYPLSPPKNKWEAIQQGQYVAENERRRLELGDGPIGAIADLLESQGIRTARVSLPEDVSGITIHDPEAGVFVAVNAGHSPLRQRFSFAHEYAHVLMDRDATQSIVSRGGNRADLAEIRANAFAAVLLMPEKGVKRFVQALGKGQAGRAEAKVFDESGVTRVQHRAKPRFQEIQVYDLAVVAHRFGVSTIAALYRMQNLGMLSEDLREMLQGDIDRGLDKEAARALDLDEAAWRPSFSDFKHRFVGLALEAYRRELISEAKLRELAALVEVSPEAILKLLEDDDAHERTHRVRR